MNTNFNNKNTIICFLSNFIMNFAIKVKITTKQLLCCS